MYIRCFFLFCLLFVVVDISKNKNRKNRQLIKFKIWKLFNKKMYFILNLNYIKKKVRYFLKKSSFFIVIFKLK